MKKSLLKFFIFFLVILIIMLSLIWYFTPDISELKDKNPEITNLMKIREEEAREAGKSHTKKWVWVDRKNISDYLVQGILIAEDDKFYEHQGFDWEAIKNALRRNYKNQRLFYGGSTITQQLAKNLYLSLEKDIFRKVKEAFITMKLEKELSKDRILEIYLNVIEFGRNIYGAEAASRFYFNKPAKNLTPSEAIRLASILPNPRKYLPFDDNRKWLNEKRVLIAKRFYERGLIDKEKYEELRAEFKR